MAEKNILKLIEKGSAKGIKKFVSEYGLPAAFTEIGNCLPPDAETTFYDKRLIDICKRGFEHGEDINTARTPDGTIFVFAVIEGCMSRGEDRSDLPNETVRTLYMLTELGMDPNAYNKESVADFVACWYGHLAVSSYLREFMPEEEAEARRPAILAGVKTITNCLRAIGCDFNAKDEHGRDFFDYCEEGMNFDMHEDDEYYDDAWVFEAFIEAAGGRVPAHAK